MRRFWAGFDFFKPNVVDLGKGWLGWLDKPIGDVEGDLRGGGGGNGGFYGSAVDRGGC